MARVGLNNEYQRCEEWYYGFEVLATADPITPTADRFCKLIAPAGLGDASVDFINITANGEVTKTNFTIPGGTQINGFFKDVDVNGISNVVWAVNASKVEQ